MKTIKNFEDFINEDYNKYEFNDFETEGATEYVEDIPVNKMDVPDEAKEYLSPTTELKIDSFNNTWAGKVITRKVDMSRMNSDRETVLWMIDSDMEHNGKKEILLSDAFGFHA